MMKTTLNENQKDIKEMFDMLNTKNISSRKYETFLLRIEDYAKSKGECPYFKQILLEEILKNSEI